MKKTKLVSSLAVSGIIAFSLSQVSAQEVMNTSMMSTDIMSSLSVGSRGDDVVKLQTFLETKGHLMMPMGVAKGYFGPITKMALVQYQAGEGLPATGYFGPLTRAKLSGKMMNDDGGVMVGGAMMIKTRDIVDNAVLAKNVTTVVAAVKAAGLVDTLKSTGPFTVFAPTNQAFDALPAGTVSTLLMPENKAKLVDILTYHVVPGRYQAKDLYDGQMLTTVQGKTLKITKSSDGKVTINGSAMVETANVISSNGVTHVITAVLIP